MSTMQGPAWRKRTSWAFPVVDRRAVGAGAGCRLAVHSRSHVHTTSAGLERDDPHHRLERVGRGLAGEPRAVLMTALEEAQEVRRRQVPAKCVKVSRAYGHDGLWGLTTSAGPGQISKMPVGRGGIGVAVGVAAW